MNFLKLLFVLLVAGVAAIEGLDFETLFQNAHQQAYDSFNGQERKPFDLDTVSGYIDSSRPSGLHSPSFNIFETNIGGDSDETLPSGASFDESLGLFNPFNRFGGSTYNLFSFPAARQPWWKGENVCVDREEKIDDPKNKTDKPAGSESSNESSDEFDEPMFNLNIESCSETPYKHSCTRINHVNGRKHTVTVTHKCCYGYARNNDVLSSTCEKQELFSVIETANKNQGSQFVKSAIDNGLENTLQQNVTVFVPTDMAFKDFAEQMADNNMVDLPSEANRSVVLNHIITGWDGAEEYQNEQVLRSGSDNGQIRINIYPHEPGTTEAVNPYKYTANCAEIVGRTKNFATNGVVTFVDRVLTPVQKTLLDVIRERSDLSFFYTILENTDLVSLLEVGEEDAPYTVFAPTDKAFESLDPQMRRSLKEANGCALNILKNHILDLTFCSTAIAKGVKTTTYNLLNEKIQFERVKENVSKSEVDDLNDRDIILINGKVKVVDYDILATNGVLYIIDNLLLSESGLPITNVMEKHNLTIFRELVKAGNFDYLLDSLSNVSFIVPEDKAFEKSEEGRYWVKLLKESPEQLKNDENLQSFLMYHIVNGATMTCNFTETMLKTKENSDVRVNLYSTLPVFLNTMNVATINCARLVHFDYQSCSSVLHQVDKVLTAPENTLLKMLQGSKRTSMFLKMVELANMTHVLSNTSSALTVLVPPNDLFEEVQDWYDDVLTKPGSLKHIVGTHILDSVECCASFVRAEWPFHRTVRTINNVHLRSYRNRRPEVQNAGITKCDIIGKNGIIHEINDIISIQPKRSAQDDRMQFQRFPIW